MFGVSQNATPRPGVEHAQTSPAVGETRAVERKQFGASDIPSIVDASQHNEARFNRDFYEQQLTVRATFDTASAGWVGSDWQINFHVGVERVCCFMPPPADLADWSRGKQMTVSGTIYTTTLGQVKLNDCKLTAN